MEERVFNSTIPVEDQHGRFAFRTDAEDAKTIIGQGFGIGMGNGQRVRAVRLTVPLSTIAAGGEESGRAVTPSSLRVKYTHLERLGNGLRLHQHKPNITGVKVGRRGVSFRPAFLEVIRSVSGGGI